MSSMNEPDHPPEYSFLTPRKQLFAFPPDVISRMLENPSSHAGLMKLYQTCKYFYAKRPTFIADDVMIGNYDSNEAVQIQSIYIKLPRDYKDITRLKVPLWLTNKLKILLCRRQRLPKFFRSSIKTLVSYRSEVQYDDFVLLVAEKNVVTFKPAFPMLIFHSDMSMVPMEEVIQHLPNIKKFWYSLNEKYSLESLIKLNELKLNTKLEYLNLVIYDVHSTFDFNLFCEFFMQNCDAKTRFYWDPSQSKNLEDAYANMDPKWKTEALDGLKELFREIESINDEEYYDEEMEEF